MKERIYSTVRLPYDTVLDVAEMDRFVVVENPEGFMNLVEVTGFESVDGEWYSVRKITRKIVARLVADGSIEDVPWNTRYVNVTYSEDPRNSTAELELYVTMDKSEEIRR